MKNLLDYKEDIHRCSKCGLCQSQCPIYQITGNDCAVSRGQFLMLKGFLNGELKMSKTIKNYLDLCLKCGKCSGSCPVGINAVDIIVSAKYEYLKENKIKLFLSNFKHLILFKILPGFLKLLHYTKKSKCYEKKVIYYSGCRGKFFGNKSVIKVLNSLNIEVVVPNFECCGITLYTDGNLKGYRSAIKKFISELKKYDTKDIITTCSSCEKTLKDYARLCNNEEDKRFLNELNIKNIYQYIRENNLKFKLARKKRITYHKPCSQSNYKDIEYILNNTENLEYILSDKYDNCCGLNGIMSFKNLPLIAKVCKIKRDSIIKTDANTVLTSCFGCETALKVYSFFRYKVQDLIDFLSKNM